ncbi:hypothetical protein [Couchioplanes caeruleus]|uniref:N-acetyltransferase domain-containing protein n=2 Tax=Couchioplanes caeruleus TaxID=56438 RepID=A0A1K0GW76_9ACTN|nr:hypothetical protein [Couchioplanes caeruleus]OJF15636.1 hypothetical protein BG844_03250 [Couchioplanes caeruleus subsp. caeruleus]ROP33815.1 hypothetical protein EDD30_6857 [Couchioplanes caeruleus]
MSESSGQVTLRSITSGNRQAVEDLRVLPEQGDFVDGVSRSLAEAAVKRHAGDGSPLGFYLKYGFRPTGQMFDREQVLDLPLMR